MSRPSVLTYGTLQSTQVKSLTEVVARALIWHYLVSDLEFMDLHRIVHRDVKPANHMVTTGDIVWPPPSKDRPHSFVAISFFPDEGRAAESPPSTAIHRLYLCTLILLMILQPTDLYICLLDLSLHRRYVLAFGGFRCRRQDPTRRLLRRRLGYEGE